MTEHSTLIWVKSVMSQLAAHHLTDSVNEIPTVQVFEPVLVRIMRVGVTIELVRRRVLNPVFITSVLGAGQNTWNNESKGLTRYSSSLNINGVMACLWLVWDPVCPQTQTAVQPMPRWLVVLGMVWKEEGIV